MLSGRFPPVANLKNSAFVHFFLDTRLLNRYTRLRYDRNHLTPIAHLLPPLGLPDRAPQGRSARARRPPPRRSRFGGTGPPVPGGPASALDAYRADRHRSRPPPALLCHQAPQGMEL